MYLLCPPLPSLASYSLGSHFSYFHTSSTFPHSPVSLSPFPSFPLFLTFLSPPPSQKSRGDWETFTTNMTFVFSKIKDYVFRDPHSIPFMFQTLPYIQKGPKKVKLTCSTVYYQPFFNSLTQTHTLSLSLSLSAEAFSNVLTWISHPSFLSKARTNHRRLHYIQLRVRRSSCKQRHLTSTHSTHVTQLTHS